MKDFSKYFIVGTNSDALHDTMNGMVVGELIRCKDCDLYGIVELKKDGSVDMRYKPRWCFLWRASMNADDYCSCAVRREK